ncbi:aldehyde dehydrogenase family protein [Streptomyces sp. LaBMicrA B280]|uniref:aldehyde dehydrogenase family protein n=1 Tax=Streptomyces sp. LaBMicrA B280 TaxID=3391001 RepID=UPI003BA754E6
MPSYGPLSNCGARPGPLTVTRHPRGVCVGAGWWGVHPPSGAAHEVVRGAGADVSHVCTRGLACGGGSVLPGSPAPGCGAFTGRGHIAGRALVDHPDVAKIVFTWSTRTGREISRRARGAGPRSRVGRRRAGQVGRGHRTGTGRRGEPFRQPVCLPGTPGRRRGTEGGGQHLHRVVGQLEAEGPQPAPYQLDGLLHGVRVEPQVLGELLGDIGPFAHQRTQLGGRAAQREHRVAGRTGQPGQPVKDRRALGGRTAAEGVVETQHQQPALRLLQGRRQPVGGLLREAGRERG